jgi:hypothetical protein
VQLEDAKPIMARLDEESGLSPAPTSRQEFELSLHMFDMCLKLTNEVLGSALQKGAGVVLRGDVDPSSNEYRNSGPWTANTRDGS